MLLRPPRHAFVRLLEDIVDGISLFACDLDDYTFYDRCYGCYKWMYMNVCIYVLWMNINNYFLTGKNHFW